MYKVSFKPSFIKQARHLEKILFEKVLKKIEFLKNKESHHLLKVHKLHGKLSGCHSLSVDYGVRIIFKFKAFLFNMAKTSVIARSKKKPKFSTRATNRCFRCGRKRGYMRDFGLCRICFRELANEGKIPGVKKSFW